jgi:hypothetical protein
MVGSQSTAQRGQAGLQPVQPTIPCDERAGQEPARNGLDLYD